MDTSLNPCLCKDLYGYLMELCLDFGFSYLLVRNSPTANNEVDWFSLVLVWLWSSMEENFVYRKLWVLGEMLSFFFLKPMFCFGHNLVITHPN